MAGATSGADWRLASCGPDQIQGFGGGPASWGAATNDFGVDYDPTNGTVSNGDIVVIGGGAATWFNSLPSWDRVQNKKNY